MLGAEKRQSLLSDKNFYRNDRFSSLIYKKLDRDSGGFKNNSYLCVRKRGAIAQLVEQRTENPCVPSSILGGTTKAKKVNSRKSLIFGSFILNMKK